MNSQRHPHLPILAILLAIGHFVVLGLGLIGRTAPYVNGGYHRLEGSLAVLDAAPIWLPLHTGAAILLVLAAVNIIPDRWSDLACHISGGVYLAWGSITFAWAATRHPPVSLLGPSFTLLLGAISIWAAAVWNDDPED